MIPILKKHSDTWRLSWLLILLIDWGKKNSHWWINFFLIFFPFIQTHFDDLSEYTNKPKQKSSLVLLLFDRFYSRPYRFDSHDLLCWLRHGRLGAWNIRIKSRFRRCRSSFSPFERNCICSFIILRLGSKNKSDLQLISNRLFFLTHRFFFKLNKNRKNNSFW